MRSILCAATILFATAGALAAQEPEGDLFTQGQEIYEENCAICHQSNGAGNPPTFPALSGDSNLADLQLIVRNIHEGRGNMPPFPELSAEEVAAVSTYIRTAWQNGFGPVMTEEVAAILEGLGGEVEQVSVWDGVYTEEQAQRGMETYGGPCGRCHGRALNGAPDDPDMHSTPPLARVKFLRAWDGRSLATLFEYTRATMPLSNPGYLSDQEYIDIIAHMLAVSNIPPGEEELPPDPGVLARIQIEQES